jgi:hypothetical protein
MTHVIGLRRLEKLALTLGHFGESRPIKHFAREDIPKIRRMVREGMKPAEIINALRIDMGEDCFRRRCKELQIRYQRRIDTSHI